MTFSLSDAKGAWSYDYRPKSGAGEGESHLNSLTRSGGFGDRVILQKTVAHGRINIVHMDVSDL